MPNHIQKAKLKQLGIRHFDDLIHDQPKEWLIQHFRKGAREYPINVSLLMRNIIWQLRERVMAGTREPLHELIRTFWYMHIKTTLARVNSLAPKADQYDQLIQALVDMVKDNNLMEYKDIGFRDNNRINRKVGINANVIVFAEKVGQADFLSEIHNQYQTSIIALGGQPSLLNAEYFVDDLKAKGVDIRRSFFLFSIVDFDTSGWIIRDAFVEDLKHYGVKHIKTVDIIHPDMLSPLEINASRFKIKDEDKSTSKKNTEWIREVKATKYINYAFIKPSKTGRNRIIWGLESEAVSSKRIQAKLKELLLPLLGKSDKFLKIHNLEQLNKSIKELILFNLTN